MSKPINLGNGCVLIGLDGFGQVKDFYYHYAGLENHVSERLVHKIGVWVEGKYSWIDDGRWNLSVDCEKDTMASLIMADNPDLGLKLRFNDIVYNEKNIFIREITIKNSFDRLRNVKIFFNQQFNIGQTHTGDTAYYDPMERVLIHYKGRRVLLINILNGKENFSDYSVGIFGIEGKDGTFRDAEDGQLTKNPIEHGQVDSVISADIEVQPNKEKTIYYWVCAAKSIKHAKKLNRLVKDKTPRRIIKSTKDYWRAWVHNQNFSFYSLGPKIIDIFNKSLVVIRTHVNNNGSIIASGDSDMLQFGRDTYGYVWPRDAAFIAIALAKAGDFNASRRFFEFCNKTITPEGYFMHKYRPDASLGSSWHPWVRNGEAQLPIQEDETALVLYALWIHYTLSKDLEFVEGLYNNLVKNAAEFMVSYRNKKTGLPKPSYDLWEEKWGTSTFTASTVFGALEVAARFANMLGKAESANKYHNAAQEVKVGIMKYLYDKDEGVFYKHVNFVSGKPVLDKTIDMSSVYGVYKFKVLDYNDPKLKRAFEIFRERLELKTKVGGIARYEGDQYHFHGGDLPGNPWFITTLWLTQYYMEFIGKESDLPDIVKRLSWVVNGTLQSGVLSEQLDPVTGEQLSASPLIWSHAEYVTAVIQYLEKLDELGICKSCYPITL